MLEEETEKLKQILSNYDDNDLNWIKYPDPVWGYPNVIQAVELLKIHESHHYNVVTERENTTNESMKEEEE